MYILKILYIDNFKAYYSGYYRRVDNFNFFTVTHYKEHAKRFKTLIDARKEQKELQAIYFADYPTLCNKIVIVKETFEIVK